MKAKSTNQPYSINPTALYSFKINNFSKSERVAWVIPLSKTADISLENIQEIIECCNQDSIYTLLFKDRLQGKRYQESDARGFIVWANEGWEKGEYFVYLIKSSDGKVIGAIDIKSDNPKMGEVGYWMNSNYPGFITNAVLGLIKLAKSAGYIQLIAFTVPDNIKSKNVLIRAGFDYVGPEKLESGAVDDKFVCKL